MRKRKLDQALSGAAAPSVKWLPLEQIATVEVTSEAASQPIEGALSANGSSGWRAAEPGEQLIRLIFDQPQALKRIELDFAEHDVERTQEFVLRWSPDGGKSVHEIVRQQWNFNPQTTPHEAEAYRVDLRGVTLIELSIVPDISGSDVQASLDGLRLA